MEMCLPDNSASAHLDEKLALGTEKHHSALSLISTPKEIPLYCLSRIFVDSSEGSPGA